MKIKLEGRIEFTVVLNGVERHGWVTDANTLVIEGIAVDEALAVLRDIKDSQTAVLPQGVVALRPISPSANGTAATAQPSSSPRQARERAPEPAAPPHTSTAARSAAQSEDLDVGKHTTSVETAPPASASTGGIDFALLEKASTMRVILDHLLSLGFRTVDALSAECARIKDQVPVLQRATDARVRRAAEVMVLALDENAAS